MLSDAPAFTALDLATKSGRLADVDQVSRCLMASAKMIRGAGDKLQRMFGVEAQRVLSEHLDEAERAVAEILSEYNDSTDDGQQ